MIFPHPTRKKKGLRRCGIQRADAQHGAAGQDLMALQCLIGSSGELSHPFPH